MLPSRNCAFGKVVRHVPERSAAFVNFGSRQKVNDQVRWSSQDVFHFRTHDSSCLCVELMACREDGEIDAFGDNSEGIRACGWIASVVESDEGMPFDLHWNTFVDHEAKLYG